MIAVGKDDNTIVTWQQQLLSCGSFLHCMIRDCLCIFVYSKSAVP